MFDATLNNIAARLINHLLKAASWATARLQPHASKTFEVRAPLNTTRLIVAPDGLLQAAPAEATPEVTITLSAGQWLRLMARDKAALQDAVITGDSEFAAALSHVAQHLEWDFEEDLSRAVGDVAAHRIAGAVRQAAIWRKDTLANTAETVKEYLTEEKPVIASREAVEQFTRDVEQLREQVERLATRIEKL